MSVKVITVGEDILGANEEKARANKKRLDSHHIFTINIMSSPGAGKTSLILSTTKHLKDKVRIAVIEGDVASSVDADKVNELGIPVIQINTAGGCHLDANMVQNALTDLDLASLDLLVVENVGNLVCPAEFNIGEDHKVMMLSVTEGDDKPYKYPLMFKESRVLLISKIDLLPHLRCDIAKIKEAARSINPGLIIFEISAYTGQGLDAWHSWIQKQTAGK